MSRGHTNDNHIIGYWTSQEQHSMQDLLSFVVEAEKNGFNSCMTSDHFHPWWHERAYGNFTWIWMAAAAERTKNMQFISGITAPVYRYNPSIIAQAFASLDVLYPGRIGLGIGTGEAMNEVPVGFDWPNAKVRLARTTEAIHIIKDLWKQGALRNDISDGFVDFRGQYFNVNTAKLYTPPSRKIPVYMAASGSSATRIAAKFTDGLITVLAPNKLKEQFDIFDKSACDEGRDPGMLEKITKPKIAYAEDYDKAFRSAGFWRASLIENAFGLSISDPRVLQQKALEKISDEKIKESIPIVTAIDDCIKYIEEYFCAGCTRLYVHSTSPDENEFIRIFCRKVLPYFKDKFKARK